MGGLSPMHLGLVLVIALLVFGPKKLPEIGRELGQAIREFKKASRAGEGSRDGRAGTWRGGGAGKEHLDACPDDALDRRRGGADRPGGGYGHPGSSRGPGPLAPARGRRRAGDGEGGGARGGDPAEW